MAQIQQTITLGGRLCLVRALPLGKLKIVLPAFLRVGQQAGNWQDEGFDDVLTILSVAFDLPLPELESIAATIPEITTALSAVAATCGLIQEESAPAPQSLAVRQDSGTGTPSTAG